MKFILPFLILGFAVPGWSAIPQKPRVQESASELAQELLSMPEANRNQIAVQRAKDLFPELIRISKNEKEAMPVRWKALTLAAYVGKDQALPELQAALKSKEWFMRNAALISLKIHHPLKAQEAARTLLKDKALVVRSAAVECLGADLDAKSRQLMWSELNADYNFRHQKGLWIRKQILSQLAEKPDTQETGRFLKALREKDSELHVPAVVAMEKLTQSQMGAKKSVAQKRELWLQWAKAHPQSSVE